MSVAAPVQVDSTRAQCSSSKLSTRLLQCKLTIGARNDPFEEEADRIAHQVLANPGHAAIESTRPRFRRLSMQQMGPTDMIPASVEQTLSSPGRPLEPALRRDMERRFGYDFSRVRVHSDSIAQRSAREVNANAYTVGDNIVIGAGNYSLRSREGLQLIAHELAHVVQQSRADRSQVASSNTRTNIFPHSTLYRAALGESGSIMPKLSFCQYGSGFCGMAAQQAKRLKAPGEDVLTCKRPPDIGVISYNTGADIIGAIGAPNRCYGWKLNELHFFGHSGNYGVFDSSNSGEIHRGLYVDWYYDHNVSDSDKQNGARKASQIPVSALSDQVVFVFHSCNTALKHSNVPPVAEGVYSRLSGTLREPKVYGHYYQVATGQLDDWIAYSRQFSSGRYQKRIIYHRQPFSR